MQGLNIWTHDQEGLVILFIQIRYDARRFSLGRLIYQQTLWEYPPGRYTIIAGICLIVIIAMLVALCCFCYWRRRQARKKQPRRYTPRGRSTQRRPIPVDRANRWSQIRPPPRGSFVPSGPRETLDYIGTLKDVHVIPYRNQAGVYREEYPSIDYGKWGSTYSDY